MPDFKSLVSKQGVLQGITSADTLVVGDKLDATGATLLSIGGTNATALSLSRPGATTTVQGPLNLTNLTTSIASISAPGFDAPLLGASMSLGGSLAGTVNLGRPGSLVSIASNVEVLGKIKGIPPVGPGQLLQFSGTSFQNSGYVPGVGEFSTPSDFGFYPVQNANFVFNPADLFGITNTYRIRVAVRVDGAFNDGLHCMLRQVVIGGVESGVPGLLDFGAGVAQIYQAVSNTLTASTTNWVWLRPYFAAYNGVPGNGATLQDVTVFLEEWF